MMTKPDVTAVRRKRGQLMRGRPWAWVVAGAAAVLAAPVVLWLLYGTGGTDRSEVLFDDSVEYTGPPLTGEMIRSAEAKVGYKLPQSYLRLVRSKNGGSLKRGCFPMRTSRANEYVRLQAIQGIGGEWGIDSETLGSRHLIRVWEYPDVGVVIGLMPSAGHDVIMLDYSLCGPAGEPRVIHVETETADDKPVVTVVAPDFETFLQGLVGPEMEGRPVAPGRPHPEKN